MLTPLQLVQSVRGTIDECDNAHLCTAIESKSLIIDVREPEEYRHGHIANAVNIPRGLVEFAIFEHPRVKPLLNQSDISETPLFLYCKSGGRSALAAQSLQNMGFKRVRSLQSGIMGWEANGHLVNTENTFQY